MKIRVEGGSDGVVTGMELTIASFSVPDMGQAVRVMCKYAGLSVEQVMAQMLYNEEVGLRAMTSQIGDEKLSALDCAVRSEINCRDIARRKSEQPVVESTEKTD